MRSNLTIWIKSDHLRFSFIQLSKVLALTNTDLLVRRENLFPTDSAIFSPPNVPKVNFLVFVDILYLLHQCISVYLYIYISINPSVAFYLSLFPSLKSLILKSPSFLITIYSLLHSITYPLF